MAFGAVDWCADTGMTLEASNPGLAVVRFRLAAASRARGREAPIDTAYLDVRDPAGFLAECALARDLGFAGKLCIHPDQVGPANAAFSPSAAEVDAARAVSEAFAAAEARGLASIVVAGRFVDYPVARRARALLARAEP